MNKCIIKFSTQDSVPESSWGIYPKHYLTYFLEVSHTRCFLSFWVCHRMIIYMCWCLRRTEWRVSVSLDRGGTFRRLNLEEFIRALLIYNYYFSCINDIFFSLLSQFRLENVGWVWLSFTQAADESQEREARAESFSKLPMLLYSS